MPPGMCTRKSEAAGEDLPGMQGRYIFIILFPFFHLLNFYLNFISLFLIDKTILVASNL